MSIAAYKKTIRQVEAPRDIERRVLTRITFDLERLSNEYDQSESRIQRLAILSNGLAEVLAENQTFWMALKHDLAEKENQLPTELRASLMSLALWTERQTHSIITGEAKVEPLISVNRSICDGLRGVPSLVALEGG